MWQTVDLYAHVMSFFIVLRVYLVELIFIDGIFFLLTL